MTSYRSYEDVSSFVVALMARVHFEHSFEKYGESRGPRPQAFNSGVAGSSRHRRDLEFRSHHWVMLPSFVRHRHHCEIGHLVTGRMGYVRGWEIDTIPKP